MVDFPRSGYGIVELWMFTCGFRVADKVWSFRLPKVHSNIF